MQDNKYQELLDENNKLKKENLYLKNLLTLNNILYEDVRKIDDISLNNIEKINLYLSLFKGRPDVFAKGYIAKDGKKRYYPVCKNKFTEFCDLKKYPHCKNCPNKAYYGLDRNELLDHFKGKSALGIYPLLDNDTCYFLATDFDNKDFKESANWFRNLCRQYNIDCAIEISQSGNGAHAWMFFDEQTNARDARKLGDFILNKALNKTSGLSLSSFDRFFPSQDYLEKDGFGNLIALPFNGSKVKENKTVFVDENFIPYTNQSAFLKSIKKISPWEMTSLLEIIKEENEIEIFPNKILKNIELNKTDFKGKIRLIRKEDIAINKDNLTLKSLRFLMRLGSVPNSEFYKKQNARQSTYGISRTFQIFKEDDSYIYLPRGCFDELITVFGYLSVEYEVVDNRNTGSIIDIQFKGELRQEQQDALNTLLAYDNGILVGPTAFGKTIVAIGIISALKTNTLILVHNHNLLNQWIEKLSEFLDVHYEYGKSKQKFGVYHGQKKKLTDNIDIGSIHSFDDTDESKKILSHYGLIIVDEVHHMAAKTFEQVIRNTCTKYIYGLTATPKRSDGNEKIIFKAMGEIRYIHEENGFSEFSKLLIPRFTRFNLSLQDRVLNYADQCNILIQDEERNKIILNDIKECYELKRNILVLTDRVDHIKLLEREIRKYCDNVLVITG